MDDCGAPISCEVRTRCLITTFVVSVAAGFPSPADDYLDRPLDFNELLIAHPAATFAVRVTGESMVGAGIFPGDIAVVDRSLSARDGLVVLAILSGDFTLKYFRKRGASVWLEAANPHFKPILITEDSEFEVWGVVRHTIRVL
ncbi:MAG: translesion error-prone DNA polymerase V autoproteolytic subunit [Hyphomicrobium sp.]|nr:translesion error-prone DNA polymerase V autoproteolytic subunit [Hyphomicrobium sp.]